MERVGFYRNQFSRKLSPIKIMLVNRKSQSGFEEWLRIVRRTKESILNNPSEYLGDELPSAEILKVSIEIIFAEFISREISKWDFSLRHSN